MRVITYLVDEKSDNITVEQFLRRQGISKRIIIDLKKDKDGLTVQNKLIRSIDRLKKGDELRICLYEHEKSENLIPNNLPIDILYSDEDFTVINKPFDMAVHPSRKNRENTVANALKYLKGDAPFVFRSIGRLDKNTSGLLVTAENALSAGILTKMAAEKRLKREYVAICTGIIPENGCIDAPIKRAMESVIDREVNENGERAVTYFKRIAQRDGFSLAHVWLETGRTHQIRVHMKHIGHPLPGDFVYNPDFSRIERHPLHAAKLKLEKPITGEKMKFYAPLPDDMKAFFPDITDEMLKDMINA